MDALSLLCVAQTLLTLQIPGDGPHSGGAVRIGLPLPISAIRRGLHLEGLRGAELQWRLLQREPGRGSDRVWVELAVAGAGGKVRLRSGGAGPTTLESGPLLRREHQQSELAGRHQDIWTHTWRDGEVDSLVREELAGQPSAETGARTTVSEAWLSRTTRVVVPKRFWRDAGVLPVADGTGRRIREQLLEALPRLDRAEAPGWRGRGDYLRGDVVTNLEFDTSLALARLALATGRSDCLERAWRSARHLVDIDTDPRGGLPCRHGRDHRSGPVEAGHVWLEGLRLVALLFADDDLLQRYRTAVRALARRVREGDVPRDAWRDRLRDELWPLWELERALQFEDLPPVRAAADSLAARVLRRWDPALGVLRYGEGESRGDSYRERLWLSCGLGMPALRLYAERRQDRAAARIVERLEARALKLMRQGPPGVPVSLRLGQDGAAWGVARVRGAAEAVLLLDGLSGRARRRVWGRSAVRSALDDLLPGDAEDLATRFTILGRGDLAWR